jgi:hypothetical protein
MIECKGEAEGEGWSAVKGLRGLRGELVREAFLGLCEWNNKLAAGC